MANSKWKLTAVLCVVAVLMFLAWFYLSSKDKAAIAADDFAKGDYAAASKQLQEVKNSLPESSYHLYMAYILREQTTLKDSSDELKLAEQTAQGAGAKFLPEIYLNQAFNAFLTQQPEAMTDPLGKADTILKDKRWVIFFKALQGYLKHDYQPALREWKGPIEEGFLSPWMKKTFSDTFDNFWYSTHLAQANIALGNYLPARQELELESKRAKERQLDEINLLLGLSYIKEAEEKPYIASTPYFKLAFAYLNRVPMQSSRFSPYRKQILAIIHNQIIGFIALNAWQDIPFYAGILEKWQDKAGLEQLQQNLIDFIVQKSNEKSWNEIGSVLKILQGYLKSDENRAVEEKLISFFSIAVNEGDIPSMSSLWENLRGFAQDSQAITRQVADLLGSYLLQMIPIDTNDLNLTTSYIDIWTSIENDRLERLGFALVLFELAESLWTGDSTEKGFALAKIALHLPLLQDQVLFKQAATQRLIRLYKTSQTENDPALLHAILKAMKELNIQFNMQSMDISKELEQAQALLDNKHYRQAFEKSRWVLELDPRSQPALRIAGLANYSLANYGMAIEYLKQLPNPDVAVKEALEITGIITDGAAAKPHLIPEAIKTHLAGNDIYARIGLGLAVNNHPKESLEWLTQITQPSPEVIAGKSYAYFQLQDWNQALDDYNVLPVPYQGSLGMQRIAIESLAALGRMEQAEKLLEKLLTVQSTPFPTSFEYLHNAFFDEETPIYIAALFYKTWLRDSAKALDFLRKIQDPSPQIRAAMGEILFQQKQYTEARQELQKALQIPKDKIDLPLELKRSHLFLAMVDSQLGYAIDAARNYSAYFESFPNEIAHRSDFAHVLMELRRFDTALTQLTLIENHQEPAPDEKIQCIACLIHLGRFQEAQWKALEYLTAEVSMPLADQLKIAAVMLAARDVKLIQTIMHRVPEEKLRSLDVNMALINLWMGSGNYEMAAKSIHQLQPTLETTVEGLVLLMRFAANAIKANAALQYAKKALKIDPYNQAARQFADQIEGTLAAAKKRLDNDLANPTLQFEYAKQLMQPAFQAYQNGDSVKDDFNLNQAKLIFKELTQTVPFVPAPFFFLGKALFLQGEAKTAQTALKQACQLDPSYSEAYQYLSKIAAGYSQIPLAFDEMYKALHYEPNNSDLWLELSQVFLQNNNSLDAIYALNESIKYKPAQARAYIRLGEIQLNSEDPEDAKKSFEAALKIDPNDIQGLKLLLITLHQPFLNLEAMNKKDLEEQQQSVYNTLHSLNPKLAEDTLNSLKQQD